MADIWRLAGAGGQGVVGADVMDIFLNLLAWWVIGVLWSLVASIASTCSLCRRTLSRYSWAFGFFGPFMIFMALFWIWKRVEKYLAPEER